MASDSPPSAPSFGAILRRFRLSAGLSQEMLAERADLSVEAISTLERGTRRAPYPATIEVIAAALDLDQSDRALLAAAVDRHRAPRQQRRLQLAPLPPSLTRIIGRDSELDAARILASDYDARLFTITGIAGVGKTRFALALAASLSSTFEDGTGFVSLAGTSDVQHVESAIGHMLVRANVEEADSLNALCAHVGSRRVLMVIDNFEHVIAGAPLLIGLLSRCPRATLLVTSREALRVAGEHEFTVAPLDLEYAVDLFIDRSAGMRGASDVKAHADVVAEICRRLDCLPLAIELAAARLRHYSVDALRERLSSRLDVLTEGTRDAPPRQTLR